MKNNLTTMSSKNSSPSHLETVSKKPRGRPPGSKNKPKPYNMQAAQPADRAGKPIIVNVPPGGDIIKYIVDVAHQRHVSVVILSVTGSVAGVTLRHAPPGGPVRVLDGPFTLVSLNGSYIYDNECTLHPGATLPSNLSFGINLCSSQGQVYGGAVSGRVIAAMDGVQVVLSTFKNPLFYKHVLEGEETSKRTE